MAARIIGVGKYLPVRVLTTAGIESVSNEDMVSRGSLRSRHVADASESAASMGAAAARLALGTAGLLATALDLIICATITPDGMFPATASLIQDAIGATRAAAFDLNAGSAGFVAALSSGAQFINAGAYQRVLVVGSDAMSRVVGPNDVLAGQAFGDGAGAVVLETASIGGPIAASLPGASDLTGPFSLRGPASAVTQEQGYNLVLSAASPSEAALAATAALVQGTLGGAGLRAEDIDYLLPASPDPALIATLVRTLSLPKACVLSSFETCGDTVSAALPIALSEALQANRIVPGDVLLLAGTGAACIVEWCALGSCLPAVE